jgi:hypothetical protein
MIAALLLVGGRPYLFSHSSGPCLEMAPGWSDFHRQPDPGTVDYQSGELRRRAGSGHPSSASEDPWSQGRVCLRWSLAGPLDDGAHLLSVERLHRRGPDVAQGAGLQRDGGGCLVVGEFGDRDDVVCAKRPDQLANLAPCFSTRPR